MAHTRRSGSSRGHQLSRPPPSGTSRRRVVRREVATEFSLGSAFSRRFPKQRARASAHVHLAHCAQDARRLRRSCVCVCTYAPSGRRRIVGIGPTGKFFLDAVHTTDNKQQPRQRAARLAAADSISRRRDRGRATAIFGFYLSVLLGRAQFPFV